jgi:RNA polymerase primary sigma factor
MKQLKITHSFTKRESTSIDMYLNEVGKYELLSPEEEADLSAKVKQGDQAALDKLTKANLRFVISVAKQYQNHGLTLSDLINEGNVGLIKAAKRFDETKGFKFISYAVWWIRQSILFAIVEYSRIVRIPHNKSALFNKVKDATTFFLQEFEREPTKAELADLLEVSVETLEDALKSGHHFSSVDSPIMEADSDVTLLDLLADESIGSPDRSLMKESLKDQVQIELSSLSPREHAILSAFYGLNDKPEMSLEEISEFTGLSKERVRQIRDRAIIRMKRSLSRNNLRTYLG